MHNRVQPHFSGKLDVTEVRLSPASLSLMANRCESESFAKISLSTKTQGGKAAKRRRQGDSHAGYRSAESFCFELRVV